MSSRNPSLQLGPQFTHLAWVGDSVVLVGEDDSFLLDVPVAGDVIRQVDGRKTAFNIASALADQHKPELVHYVLLSLEREGLLRPVSATETECSATESLQSLSPAGGSLARDIRAAWEEKGSKSVVELELSSESNAPFRIAITDDYLTADLLDVQEASKERGDPFLLISLGSRRIWAGPWIQPGVTPCVSCLQERLRINLASRALLHVPASESETTRFEVEPLPRTIPWAAYSRVAEVILDGTNKAEPGAGVLRVLPLGDDPPETHQVPKLPHCRLCGNPALGPPGPNFQLKPSPRYSASGGGYRSVAPDETARSLAHLVSPLTGVIRHVRKVPVEGASLAHVYSANHAHCFNETSIRTLRSDRRDHSGGKGMTDQDARVSAMCEAVERFSSVHRGTEASRIARWSDLGPTAVLPNDLLLFSDQQYECRKVSNQSDPSGFQWVPEPYQDEPIEWSAVQCLNPGGGVRWVPSAAVFLGFGGEGNRFCKGDSNGLASGNCLEEAILQGFLELAERDAVALWWYNRISRPRVDLESFRDSRVNETVKLYPRLGRKLWVLDLTTDLGIPAFAGVSALVDGPPEDIIFGFGAHLDPSIALLRTLSELNQMLPTILRTPEERRRQLLPDFEDAIRWWETASLEEHTYLEPASDLLARTLTDFPQPKSGDLLEDVQECVRCAAQAGHDVLVHDLTRPDVGFPVARVLVPGFRHFWRRLGPGRLYDVPMELGWLDEPKPESDMNPISMFV